MKDYIEVRCNLLADFIVSTKATVREAAKAFGVSKSTVHKDVTTRLAEIDYGKFLDVQDVLSVNLKERHLRGGDATKAKYFRLKESKQ